MDFDKSTATAMLAALGLAQRHGGAGAALRAGGIDMPDAQRFVGLAADFGDVLGPSGEHASVSEALALGYIAGRVTHQARMRTKPDPTSFVMDPDLMVQAAEGESILRLPWFEEELFVGRQLPEIHEMPSPVRRLCIENYTAALAGERGRFSFSSYGHAYSVEAVPVRGDHGRVNAVLAVATPDPSFTAAAREYERAAERFDRSADRAEQRADAHREAERKDEEAAERGQVAKARRAASYARANARKLHSRTTGAVPAGPPSITPRQAEILGLASHGLTANEIADELCVSATTVRTHLENVYARLGAADKAAAVAVALRHGLID